MPAETSWLEIALTVKGELAEAVAEVLGRFAPGGVVLESLAIADEPAGVGHPTGPLRVAAYLPADQDNPATRLKIAEALWYLGRIQPLPDPHFRLIHETNWMEAWQAHYQPIPVGRRMMILPAWSAISPQDRVPIYIDPGLAFGTGTHPSTQLCLELIEDWVQGGKPVIDLGCGSGILSIAALKLGASQALGVDIDPQAIDSARENARLNRVAPRIALSVGSLESIRSGSLTLQRAPLVLANILATVIIRLLKDGLSELLTQDGVLILSGLLEDQEADVLQVVQESGLTILQRKQSEDWVALATGF